MAAAAKAASTFLRLNFSGFCPNETPVLEKKAKDKHWGVVRSREADVTTGECEPGAFMRE